MAVLKHFCCGCSLQAGTVAIAVLYLIWCLGPRATLVPRLYTEQYIYDAKNHTWRVWDNTLELEVAVGSAFIQAICGIFLLFGSTLEIAGLLLPWIIVKTLDLVVMTAIDIITCFFLIAFATKATAALIGIAAAIISSLFGTYCLMVVYSYYQTLLENERPKMVKEITLV